MKNKTKITCGITVVLFILTGCSKADIKEEIPEVVEAPAAVDVDAPDDTEEHVLSEPEESETELPVRESECAEISFTLGDTLKPGGATFAISATEEYGEKKWYYDEFYTLERYVDGTWEELPMLSGLCGTTSYWEIIKDAPMEVELDWGILYGPLEQGIYCVSKEVFPEKNDIVNSLLAESMPEEADYLSSTGPDTSFGVPVYAVFELKEGLGVTLILEDIKPTGLTMGFARDGGSPTGELKYGSEYWLERLEEGRWHQVEYKEQEHEVAWTMEAYNITEEPYMKEIDWEWLYGELPSGQYKFCKRIMDFRETGDYDLYNYSAEFEIP